MGETFATAAGVQEGMSLSHNALRYCANGLSQEIGTRTPVTSSASVAKLLVPRDRSCGTVVIETIQWTVLRVAAVTRPASYRQSSLQRGGAKGQLTTTSM